jgi:hypothetical protein
MKNTRQIHHENYKKGESVSYQAFHVRVSNFIDSIGDRTGIMVVPYGNAGRKMFFFDKDREEEIIGLLKK